MLDVRLDPAIVVRAGKVLWLIVIATIWILQWKRKKQQPVQVEDQLLIGSCLMLVTDYFLPIRVEYADVMFLTPMALLMPVMLRREYRMMAVLFVVAMLIPLAPVNRLPFNAAAPAAMLRSALVVYLLVRFTILGSNKLLTE
jgi:membrane-associated HD superfamily phosphohydrolase